MDIKFINNKNKLTDKTLKEAVNQYENFKEEAKPKTQKYYDMNNSHKTELKRICMEAGPWEWSFGIDLLVEHLRWMRDYYTLGENVWGKEDKEWKKGVKYTRLEGIEKALYYYDMWKTVEDRYIFLTENPTGSKLKDNGDGTSTVVEFGYNVIYKCDTAKRTYKKIYKEERKYKRLFYKMLEEHMEEWWD